jgi:hypothetical protein
MVSLSLFQRSFASEMMLFFKAFHHTDERVCASTIRDIQRGEYLNDITSQTDLWDVEMTASDDYSRFS